MDKFFKSKSFQIATWMLTALIVLLLVFKLGVFVGYKKARFSYRWGENYHRNFGGPRGGFFKNFMSDRRDFIGPHGLFGSVLSVDGANIIVQGRDNIEKIVQTADRTVVMRSGERIPLSDLKPDDDIVVIGAPGEAGQIDAKFIRIFPPQTSRNRQ